MASLCAGRRSAQGGGLCKRDAQLPAQLGALVGDWRGVAIVATALAARGREGAGMLLPPWLARLAGLFGPTRREPEGGPTADAAALEAPPYGPNRLASPRTHSASECVPSTLDRCAAAAAAAAAAVAAAGTAAAAAGTRRGEWVKTAFGWQLPEPRLRRRREHLRADAMLHRCRCRLSRPGSKLPSSR